MTPASGEALPRIDATASAIPTLSSPTPTHRHWCWEARSGSARFAFYGKPVEGGEERDIDQALKRGDLALATVRQVHSARVVHAAAGPCGEADALFTRRTALALRVVTADCVPVLLASEVAIAAVHAGWRGLAAGIVGAAVRELGCERPIQAVIGPAIGPCCYQVGEDVADRVALAAGSRAVIVEQGRGERPHLDLPLAARLALEGAGVEAVATVGACTRCERDRLWSYRRQGARAGRNVALVWRDSSRADAPDGM